MNGWRRVIASPQGVAFQCAGLEWLESGRPWIAGKCQETEERTGLPRRCVPRNDGIVAAERGASK